jgi:hypothetical protein
LPLEEYMRLVSIKRIHCDTVHVNCHSLQCKLEGIQEQWNVVQPAGSSMPSIMEPTWHVVLPIVDQTLKRTCTNPNNPPMTGFISSSVLPLRWAQKLQPPALSPNPAFSPQTASQQQPACTLTLCSVVACTCTQAPNAKKTSSQHAIHHGTNKALQQRLFCQSINKP